MSQVCVEPALTEQWSSVTPLSSAAPWMGAAFANLRELAELPVNWDGYHSPAIDPAIVEQAGRILSALEIENVPVPSIGPVSGGGLQLEWQFAGRELEIEVLPDRSVQVLLVNGKEMEEFALSSFNQVDEVRDLISWLVQG
jgi:hypothetical protein